MHHHWRCKYIIYFKMHCCLHPQGSWGAHAHTLLCKTRLPTAIVYLLWAAARLLHVLHVLYRGQYAPSCRHLLLPPNATPPADGPVLPTTLACHSLSHKSTTTPMHYGMHAYQPWAVHGVHGMAVILGSGCSSRSQYCRESSTTSCTCCSRTAEAKPGYRAPLTQGAQRDRQKRLRSLLRMDRSEGRRCVSLQQQQQQQRRRRQQQ
jgi:hypothetical protein